jgi:hypothetical protein
MKTIGKWLYIIGLLLAGLIGLLIAAGMTSLSNQWISLILALVGILAAIFFLDSEDLVNAGIRFLVLAIVKDALTAVPAIGKYFGGFFNGVFMFLGPVLLTLLVLHFIKKYFKM